MSDREVMNAQEAADFLGVSVWTVREMAKEGRLPARKVGREWRFLRAALLGWLAGDG